MPELNPYPLIDALHAEAQSAPLHPQLSKFVSAFLSYLKVPRYLAPLTLNELRSLFFRFYRDLTCIALATFAKSNSNKKLLISSCKLFNDNAMNFDYLVAISNYSSSSIKLSRRLDPHALYQLRVFNFYKFVTIHESIESAQRELFLSTTTNEDASLYDKLLRFYEKDIIFQEFLQEKLAILRKLKLPFSFFSADPHAPEPDEDLLERFRRIELCTPEDIAPFTGLLHEFSKESVTPAAKIATVSKIHKALVKLLLAKGFKAKELNNDLLLPLLIYMTIYYFDASSDLYLGLNFIHNFSTCPDPFNIPVYPVSVGFSYNPTDGDALAATTISSIFSHLNLGDVCSSIATTDAETPGLTVPETLRFFDTDRNLVDYIADQYYFNGQNKYYLTNFEAALHFLANITSKDIQEHDLVPTPDSTILSHHLLGEPIAALTEKELALHFQLPTGKLSEESPMPSQEAKGLARLRSSSVLHAISAKLDEARSRSNSGFSKSHDISSVKEPFPASNPEAALNVNGDDSSGSALMRNLFGRISSLMMVSGMPSNAPRPEEPLDSSCLERDTTEKASTGINFEGKGSTAKEEPEKNQGKRLSGEATSLPRGGPLAFEVNPFFNNTNSNVQATKHLNTISSKFSSGVSEFMTKITAPVLGSTPQITLDRSRSQGSLQLQATQHSIEGNVTSHYADALQTQVPSNVGPSPLRGLAENGRARTSSLQIMDKWLGTIGGKTQPLVDRSSITVSKTHDQQLFKYVDVEFEDMTIHDLRLLKLAYDEICNGLAAKATNGTQGSDDLSSAPSDEVKY